ncbi:OmpA family protein [Paraburkholderia sacchari]|uniref:hypothetical protein n=1 Tax=Paraburkholderia sacchari TaxID=159450 RepID=UPI0039A5038B
MKIQYYYLIVVATTLSAFTSQGFAKCQGSQNMPSEQIFIPFEKNEKAPSPAEVRRLKDWASAMNKKYHVQQWLSIGAHAQPDEDMPDTLALSRAVSTAKLALDDGLVKAPIEIKSHVGSMGNPASYGDNGRSVTLQLNPGCPDNCCDGQ